MRAKVIICLLISISLSTPSHGATPTPKNLATPTPSKKAVVTNSDTAKPTAVSSKSPSIKPTKKPSKKPIKKKVKKTATPIPSPSPIWPPVGFTSNKGIYAKIPTSKELLGLISAKVGLSESVKKCDSYACGAVIVAADFSCSWWEIKSTIYGISQSEQNKQVILGRLRTIKPAVAAKTYANIILISDEPLFGPSTIDPETGLMIPGPVKSGISIGAISAICHKSATEQTQSTNSYTPVK